MTQQEQKELIRKSIREMVKDMVPVQTFYATVKSVDWDAKTMTVEIDGLEMTDVLLSIDGSEMDVKKPKVGSNALIGIIDNEEQALFMIWCAAYEEWHLNGDAYGGLIKIEKLIERMNKIESKHDSLCSQLELLPVPVSGAVSGPPVPGSYTSVKITDQTLRKDLENEKIKHG